MRKRQRPEAKRQRPEAKRRRPEEGLSRAEIAVLWALPAWGFMRPATIASITRLPLAEITEALGELGRLGLVRSWDSGAVSTSGRGEEMQRLLFRSRPARRGRRRG